MLFELFITIHLQLQFMVKVISSCRNTKFEYDAKLTKQMIQFLKIFDLNTTYKKFYELDS